MGDCRNGDKSPVGEVPALPEEIWSFNCASADAELLAASSLREEEEAAAGDLCA